MVKINNNILFFLAFLNIKMIFISCIIPNAPQYESYDTNNKKIRIKADEIEDASNKNYKFTYIIEDVEQIIETDQNIIDIDCEKGKQILIYYSYSTSNMASENSPKNSFYCATIPSIIDDNTINYFTSTENKVFLSWSPPSDDGGSPIQKYLIKYKKKNTGTSSEPNEYTEINSLESSIIVNENIEPGNTYEFYIYPINYIVSSIKTDFLEEINNAAKKEIEVKKLADSKNCILSGNGLENFSSTTPSVEIKLEAYNTDNEKMTSVDSIFMLQVQDYCILTNENNKFICERQTSETTQNIFESEEDYIIETFEKVSDSPGDYNTKYSIFGNGKITIFVYQLIKGGLLGQYYDNVWFLEPFINEKVDYKIDFKWEENTNIINNLNNFISIRWIGALLSPETNLFTFSISSDDGIRIYLNNKNVFDHLNSPCDACYFEYNMKENEFYWIKIEFVQMQGPSRIKLFWQTSSRAKEIIPSEYLFFPEIVKDIPKTLEISNENIHPAKCYVEKHDKIVFVGKVSKINIIPVNINDEKITINNNNAINFDISIINKDQNIKNGNLYFQSKLDNTDTSNPFFYAEFIPLIPGEYTVEIKFGSTSVKNSPYNIIVKHGEVSPIYSIVNDKDNIPPKNAGLITKIKLNLYDVMNNKYNSEPDYFPVNIKFVALWKEREINENECSTRGILDENKLSTKYAGNAKSNNDGTYDLTISPLKSGKYELFIYINEQLIKDCPFNLNIKPSIIDATKCIYNIDQYSLTAGNNFEIYYQCKDTYENNINNNDIAPGEIYLILNGNSEIKINGQYDTTTSQFGCYLFKFETIEKAGTYKTNILINGLLIPQIEIEVSPSTPNHEKTYVENINDKSKYFVGDNIQLKMICLDKYENLIKEENKCLFTFIIKNGENVISADNALKYEGNGIYIFSKQFTSAGTYSFNILLNSGEPSTENEIKNSPITDVILYPSKPREGSIIKINENVTPTPTSTIQSFIAGETITSMKALLKDEYGNIIEEQGNEKIYLDFMEKNNISNTFTFEGKYMKTSDNFNYYFYNVLLMKATEYSISLKIIDNFGLIGYYYQSADFYNLLNKQERNYHKSLNNLDKSYTKIDPEINFSPIYLSFTDDLPFELISIEWKGYLKSNTSEMYTIYLDIFGKALLYLDNELVINYMESINGNENNGEKYTPNFVNVYLKQDELIPIKLIYIKNKDEILSKIIMSWESDSIQKQVIPQYNLYSDIYSEDEQFIKIEITKTDIDSLEIINEKILSNCILDNENKYIFKFKLYDIFGNEINENRINVDILIKVYLIKVKDQSVLNCDITFDSTNGEYVYVATCEVTDEGNYNLEIEISYKNEGINKLYNNFELFTCSKNSDLNLCNKYIIEGAERSQSIAGVESTFTLYFIDDEATKNIIYSCANVVLLSATIISTPSGSYKIPVSVVYDSSIDSENYGKFIFSYTGFKASEYKIQIYLNNANIEEEFEMELSPGEPSNEISQYIQIGSNIIEMGNNFDFEINLYDSYSNLVDNVDYKIYSEIRGKFGIYKNILTKESTSPSYKASFIINRINDTFSGCGIGTLSSFILKKGVRINYFNNYFVNGNPFISEIKKDGKIKLDLGTDDLLGNLYDKLYTSIQYMFYFKPESDSIYHFLIYSNGNNIRLYFDDELVIDSFSKPLLNQYSFTTSEKLNKDYVYSFRLNIYIRETTVKFFINYYTDDNAELKLMDIVNNNIFYSDKNPIGNKKNNINFYSNPGKVEKIYQDLDTKDKIRIKWEKPKDDGCNEIKKYKIHLIDPIKDFIYELNNDDLSYELPNADVTDLTIEQNKEYQFQISAINTINGNDLESAPSDIFICKLTSYTITNFQVTKLTENENDIISISWDEITISTIPNEQINYHLEYCLSDTFDNFIELYSGSNPKYEMNAKTHNLKYGQEYKFRVYAEIGMNKGEYSDTKTFYYSGRPEKPPSPPKIDIEKTTKDHLEFTFEPIIQNNGAPINKYIISININDNEETNEIPVTVTNSNIYRYTYIPVDSNKYIPITVRYLAENDNGRGPFSDPSLPMYAATKPDKPSGLSKDLSSSQKGIIKIKWVEPTSDGGAPILGYKIYLNEIYITSVQSNVNKYSFQNIFDINDKNKIAVSAYNIMGESEKYEIKDVDSTSVPGKINTIKLESYSSSSLTVIWEEPSNNGGLSQLSYGIRINDGSEIGKNFIDEEKEISILEKKFEGLSPSKYYTIQIRAYNSNGAGEWSDYITFFTGEAPGAVQNFKWEKDLSDKSKIVLTWEPPSDDGGCDIYGYKIFNGGETLLYNGKDLFFIFDYKFNIIPSNYYYFEIYAYNCAYESTQKSSVFAYSAKVPEKMNPITFNKYDPSEKSLSILYDDFFYDGGLPIKYIYTSIICDNCENNFNKEIKVSDFKSNEIIIKDDSFEQGKIYKIQIWAENEVGNGEKSDEKEIILDDIPQFPENFAFEVNCVNDKFNVNWKIIPGSKDNPIGYRIYLSENYIENNQLNSYTLIYDTFRRGAISNYVLNSSKLNLIESKLYHIYLTAYNFDGETEPVYTNFYYGKLPPTPYALRLYDISETEDNKYNIVIGFKLNISKAILPIYFMLKNKRNTQKEIRNIGYDKNNLDIILIYDEEPEITIGEIDTYYLKAVNDIGEGEWSYPLEVNYSVHPNKPGEISIKKRLNKTSLIITWEEDAKIEKNAETLGYAIYLNSFLLYDSAITTNCNEYTFTDLIPGKKYQIKIKSVNKLGESLLYSDFEFIAGLVPTKVLNVRRSSYSEDGVKIIFDPPEDDGGSPITSYKCIKIINGEETQKKAFNLGEDLSVTFNGKDLENDRAIFYINATNAIGDGPEEKDIYIFYKGKAPSMPKDLKVNKIIPIENKDDELSQTNLCNAYIRWNASEKDNGSPIYKYQILIMNNSNNEYELLDDEISPSLINNYLIKNLIIGTEYKLQISAFNSIGQGDLYNKSFSTVYNPSPPLNLTITSQENGKIELSWTKPLFINGQVITNYFINYQDLSLESSSNTEIPTDSINTAYNLINLNINHQYKIYIKAKNEKYKSESSNIVYGYAINPPEIDDDDLTPKIEVITPNSMKISWTNGQKPNEVEDIDMPPIIGYEVYIRDINESFYYKLIYDGKYIDNVLETKVDGLINGHNYGVVYYAYSKVGRSNRSKEGQILCATPPSPPEGLVLESVTESKININWYYSDTMNSNLVPLKGFYIYIGNDKIKEDDSSEPKLIPANNNSLEINVVADNIYELGITAVNSAGESKMSENILIVKAGNIPKKPTLDLTNFDSNYCELSFKPNDNSAQRKFILYLKNENNNDLSIIYEGSSLSYNHGNLSPFTKYTYTLSVKNEIGESPKSSSIECTTYPLSSSPGKINLIKSDYTSIELKWSPPSEVYTQINKYKLYMRSDEGGIFNNIIDENILTYEVKDIIEPSKQYEFYVTAVDIYDRESPKTNVVKYYCASVPNKVSNINIDEINKPNKIKLSWTYEFYSETNSENQLPNLYYKVYYKDESIQNSNYEIIKVADIINNYYILDNLLYWHTYSFYVSAVNQVGEGEKSEIINKKLIYPPDPPDIFYIKDVNLGSDNVKCKVTFEWQHTKNINNEENKLITKYNIQAFQLGEDNQRIGDDPEKEEEVTEINFPNLMTCDIDGFEKDKNYEIIIKSCINDEAESEGVKITKKIMLKPTKIESIEVNEKSRSRTSLGITWNKNENENINFYLIYILSNKEGDTLEENDYIISYKNEYLFTNLEKGENLKIQIEAVNDIGAGPKSDIKSMSIYGLPDSPTNIYISSKTKTDITINFSPTNEDGGSPITKYILYRSTNSFFINREQIKEFVISDNNINILTFKDENLSPCNLYYYTVTSVNELGENEISKNSVISAFTQIGPSSYSADLTITKIGNNSFYINWKEIDEENNGGCKNDITYILYMKAVEQNSEYTEIYSGNNRYYKVGNLDLWKKYKFKLVVANSINSVEIEEKESTELTGYILPPPKNLRLIERKITKSAGADPITTISVKIMWDIIEYDSSFNNYKIYYSNSIYSNNVNSKLSSEINQNEFELKNTDYSDLIEGKYIYFYISTINLVNEGPKSRPLKVLVGEIPSAPQTELKYINNPKSKSITLQIPSLEELGDIYGGIIPSRYIIKMNDKIVINSTSSINTINNLQLGNTYTFTYALSNIIYEENNLLNESLNFGGETKVELKPILEQVQNLRFGQHKNKLYADKVKLEWDPLIINNESLLMNFIIYQSCESCTTSTDPIPIDADALSSSKIIVDLTPGNKYSFYITGKYQGNFESPKSNIIFFTSGLKPSKPETPTLVEFTTSSIKIKIKTSLSDIETGGITDHPLDIIKFIIYKNGNKYEEKLKSEITIDNEGYSEYSFNNLIKGEEYYIQISYINIIGESELSDKLFVTPSYHPSAPLNLRIVSQSSSEIKLSWDEPLDSGGLPIISYEINIKEKSVSGEPESQEKVQETSFSFSKAGGEGNEYIFKVRAINKYSIDNNSESDRYKWTEEVTGYLISIPSPVQGLTVNDDYDKYQGVLTWTPLSDGVEKGYSNNIKYILNVKYDNPQKKIDDIDIAIGSNSYNFKVPILGMKYYFKIIAKNEVGSSESNEIEIIFRSKPKQMKPLVLKSMSVFAETPYIQLSWADDITNENIKNELQYYIISMKKKDESDADIKTIYEENNIDNKNIIIKNKEDSSNSIITPGEIYYFYISAKSDRGLSERSEGLEVIFVEAPQSIDSVEKNVNADHIEIKWKIDNILNGGNDITGFIIQKKLSINSNYKNFNLTISSTTDLESQTIAKGSDDYFSIKFTNDYLKKGFYYNFRIAAYNKYVNNLDSLNFNEPLSILFATEPSQITTFAQDFDNLKQNQVNLRWGPPGDNGGTKILNYIITKIITNENNEVSYELLSLSSDINYYEDNDVEKDNVEYTIRSVNAAGESVESEKVPCHPGLKPGKVLNLKTTSVEQNKIIIQFNKPENVNQLNCPITEYKISYKIGDNNELSGAPTYDNQNEIYKFELSMSTSTGGTSYYNEGTKIIFTVYGVNSVGNGQIEELTTFNCNIPQEPEFSIYERRETGIDFYFKPNIADLEKMKNNKNCKLTKFQLYRDDEIACEGTSRIVKCSIDNLENGSNFNFKLIYYNNVGGESVPKKIENCKIGALPNAIGNLKIEKIEIDESTNKGNMDISWDRDTSNSNNLGIKYYVLYAKEGEAYPTDINNYIATDNKKNVADLEQGQKYKIKVYAENDIGTGKESELKQIVDNPPEMTETDVTFSDITCNSFKINWNKVSSSTYPIQYYTIYKNGEFYHKFTIESNDSQEKYEYSIENLEKLISYQIGITAVNEVGESSMIIKTVKTCVTNTITAFNIIKKEGENNYYKIRWDYDQDQNDQNKCYCNVAESDISIFKNEITDTDDNVYNGIKEKEISINEYEYEFNINSISSISPEITKLIFKIIIYDENGMTTENIYEWDKSQWTSTS